MMGRAHSLSAAVGWLGGCAGLAQMGERPTTPVVIVGAAVSAGMALLPDIDHSGSTVARTLGPVTRGIASIVAWGSAAARNSSCRHCSGGPERGGHRTVTHTAAGALAAGLIAGIVGWQVGKTAALIIIGLGVWLLAHTALSSKNRAKVGDWLLPGRFRRHGRWAHRFAASVGAVIVAALSVAVTATQTGAGGWWWIGLPVAWGCLAHCLGDAMTLSGCPVLWPLQVQGCRWRSVGTPRWMRFRTGSRVETGVVAVMAVAGFAAAYALAVA